MIDICFTRVEGQTAGILVHYRLHDWVCCVWWLWCSKCNTESPFLLPKSLCTLDYYAACISYTGSCEKGTFHDGM